MNIKLHMAGNVKNIYHQKDRNKIEDNIIKDAT